MSTNTNTKHALIARTRRGNYRVGGISDWRNAMRRWDAATSEGRNTAVTVDAYLDGKWTHLDGDLCVRGADDPMVATAPLANNPKLRGTTANVTVRSRARNGAKVR